MKRIISGTLGLALIVILYDGLHPLRTLLSFAVLLLVGLVLVCLTERAP